MAASVDLAPVDQVGLDALGPAARCLEDLTRNPVNAIGSETSGASPRPRELLLVRLPSSARDAQRLGLAAARNLVASLGRGGALAWSIAQTAAAVS